MAVNVGNYTQSRRNRRGGTDRLSVASCGMIQFVYRYGIVSSGREARITCCAIIAVAGAIVIVCWICAAHDAVDFPLS